MDGLVPVQRQHDVLRSVLHHCKLLHLLLRGHAAVGGRRGNLEEGDDVVIADAHNVGVEGQAVVNDGLGRLVHCNSHHFESLLSA